MSVEIVKEEKHYAGNYELNMHYAMIAKDIVDACEKCSKFKKFEKNIEDKPIQMDWITCLSFGKQRIKTCSTCTKNANNKNSKKNIRSIIKQRNGMGKYIPDAIKKQRVTPTPLVNYKLLFHDDISNKKTGSKTPFSETKK